MHTKPKKTQISFFIILAFFIIIGLVLFISSNSEKNSDDLEIKGPVNADSELEILDDQVNECIEDILTRGMYKYGYGDITILKQFLNDNLADCIVDINEIFYGKSVMVGEPEDINILLDTNTNYLDVNLEIPLVLEKEGQSFSLQRFKAEVPTKEKKQFNLAEVKWWKGGDVSGRRVDSGLIVQDGGVGIEFVQTMLNTDPSGSQDEEWGTVYFFWQQEGQWHGKSIEHIPGWRPSNTKNGLHYVLKNVGPDTLPMGWKTCYNGRNDLGMYYDAAVPPIGEEVYYLVIESDNNNNRTDTAPYTITTENKCTTQPDDQVPTSYYEKTNLNVNVKVIGETNSDGFLSMTEFKNKLYAGTYSMSGKVNIYSYSKDDGWKKEVNLPVGESAFDMKVFKDNLYVICEGNGEIFKSPDGSNYVKIFEQPDHELGLGMGVFENKLYATFSDFKSGDNQDRNAEGPRLYVTEDGNNFRKVDWAINRKGGCVVYEIVTFNNKLYTNVYCNGHTLTENFESSDGEWWALKSSPEYFRSMLPKDGNDEKMFGIKTNLGTITLIESTDGIHYNELIELKERPTNYVIYKDDLYILTSACWKCTSGTVKARLLRYSFDDEKLTLIHEFNEYEARISQVYEGSLYVGTKDHSSRKARMYKIDVS